MANPQVNQGTLNRLKGNLVISDHPELNIAAFNLGENGMSIAFEGNATLMINTLVGRVTSPEPYVAATITVQLLKTQNIANLYKLRLEKFATLGDVTLYPDSSTLGSFSIKNCAIEKIDGLAVNGKEATVQLVISGTYQINDDLYNLV